MCALRQGLRRSFQSSSTHADPFGGQELRVQAVPQDLRPEVIPQQAFGIGLPEGRGGADDVHVAVDARQQ